MSIKSITNESAMPAIFITQRKPIQATQKHCGVDQGIPESILYFKQVMIFTTELPQTRSTPFFPAVESGANHETHRFDFAVVM